MFLKIAENFYILLLRYVIALAAGLLLMASIGYGIKATRLYSEQQRAQESAIALSHPWARNHYDEAPRSDFRKFVPGYFSEENEFKILAENPALSGNVEKGEEIRFLGETYDKNQLEQLLRKDLETFSDISNKAPKHLNPDGGYSYKKEFLQKFRADFLDDFDGVLEKTIASTALNRAVEAYSNYWQEIGESARQSIQMHPLGNFEEEFNTNADSITDEGAWKNLWPKGAKSGAPSKITVNCDEKNRKMTFWSGLSEDGKAFTNREMVFSALKNSEMWTDSTFWANDKMSFVSPRQDAELWVIYNLLCPGNDEYLILSERLGLAKDKIKADYADYKEQKSARDSRILALGVEAVANLWKCAYLAAAFLVLVFATIVVMIERNLRVIAENLKILGSMKQNAIAAPSSSAEGVGADMKGGNV